MKLHHALPATAAYRAEHAVHPLVCGVGFLDGYHLGHRALVREVLRMRRAGERTAIVTFREHPSAFLRPGTEPPMISTLEERVNAFARAGIDETFLLPFDEKIAALTPEQFLDDVLAEAIGAVAMVVGENFRFGHKRAGDVPLARAHLAARGLRFSAVPNVSVDGERVSSTRIRAAIASGDIATADRLLGAPYALRGIVELGAGRGHDLGFPTANVRVPAEKLLPPDGVYTVVGRHDGRDHPGLLSIGTNPTFNGRTRTVEAWLLDFQGSLYGEELVLRDLRFVREQRHFGSVEELMVQMQADAEHVAFPGFGT